MENRLGLIFQNGSAKLHTSFATRQILWKLGWDLLSHSPYSSDLGSSYHHSFRFINSKTFNDADHIKSHFIQIFPAKNQKICKHGIMALLEGWYKVVGKKNGQSLIE